ncbi:MAG: LysR family transcriptional regulator [Rubrivivax sp.]
MNLLDAYRYLAALERHRHFGRAADACHITQPALSNALRALEAHLGVAIVRRSRQYEGLTSEGEQVLATAHRVLREQEALRQELASGAGQPRGRLTVGSVPTALPIAARFTARLVERHPGIKPQLRSLSSQEIEQGLHTLALDLGFGFVERVAQDRRLSVWPQYDECHHLVQRASAQDEAPAETATWAEAAALRLGVQTPEMHYRSLLDRVFGELGLTVQPALETDSVLALVVAVQSGGFAAVLPGALVGALPSTAGLRVRPLRQPQVLTPVGCMSSAQARPSRALQAALELARSAAWREEARAFSGALD